MPIVRRIASLTAIYAIALHAILWGMAPLAAGAAIDPASVICHSVVPAGSDQQSPDNPDQAPAHACDHCTLCSAIAAPSVLDDVLAGQLAPARLLNVLRPASTDVRASIAATPKLARGPPAFA